MKSFRSKRDNVQAQFVSRFAVGFGFLAVAGCVAAYIMDVTDLVLAVGMAVIGSVLLFAYWWRVRLQTTGNIEVTDQGFTIRTGSGRETYPWAHVKAVRITSPGDSARLDRLIYSLFRINLRDQIIEVTFSRRLRVGLLPGSRGTTVVGVPTLAKNLHLYPEDVQGFARTASLYVGRGVAITEG